MSEKSTSDKMDNKSAQRPTYKTSWKSYITRQWVKTNPFEAAARINELERENAALRADRERLDWLETLDCDSHWWVHIADSTNLRAAIDAARKEAQP